MKKTTKKNSDLVASKRDERENRGINHIYLMYALIVLLAAALAFTAFKPIPEKETDNSTWQCINAVCSKYIDPQEWLIQNCASSIDEEGEEQMLCNVNIEGVVASLPLEMIDLEVVAQQCEVVTCIQEVNVREANYTIEQ